MSDEDARRSRGRIIAAALVVLVALLVAGWLMTRGKSEGQQPRDERADVFASHAAEASSSPRARSTDRTSRDQAPSVIRQKLPSDQDARRRQAHDAGDTGAHSSQDTSRDTGPRWADPTNQRVLGQKSWMAKLPDAEAQSIDKTFDASASRQQSDPRYPIDLAVRRTGVELAKGIVYGCYEELGERAPQFHRQAAGRVSVAFDLVADGRRGRFLNAEIPANVNLQESGFERCILDGLAGASFATSEQGTMRVEYPFLFDER